MASLIFAHAKSIYNKREKHINELRKHYAKSIDDDGFDVDAARTQFIERERTKFRDVLQIAQLLHDDYVEATGKAATDWFFVTVRPRPGVTFEDFYILTYKWVNRKFMETYNLSFEQKSIDGSGEGFHIHVVCCTKHRSKGECLRDTISSFRKCCEENCIDVQTTRNPADIVKNYLIEYKSDDAHKEPTKKGDKIWRLKMGLAPLYSNGYDSGFSDLPRVPGGCLSSPETAIKIPSGPVIVELD